MNTYAADGTMKCENDKKKCLDSKTQISTTCRDKSLQKLCASKASLFFFLETERKSFFLCRERKNKYCGGKKKQARAMKQGRCIHLSWSHRKPPPKKPPNIMCDIVYLITACCSLSQYLAKLDILGPTLIVFSQYGWPFTVYPCCGAQAPIP